MCQCSLVTFLPQLVWCLALPSGGIRFPLIKVVFPSTLADHARIHLLLNFYMYQSLSDVTTNQLDLLQPESYAVPLAASSSASQWRDNTIFTSGQ